MAASIVHGLSNLCSTIDLCEKQTWRHGSVQVCISLCFHYYEIKGKRNGGGCTFLLAALFLKFLSDKAKLSSAEFLVVY